MGLLSRLLRRTDVTTEEQRCVIQTRLNRQRKQLDQLEAEVLELTDEIAARAKQEAEARRIYDAWRRPE